MLHVAPQAESTEVGEHNRRVPTPCPCLQCRAGASAARHRPRSEINLSRSTCVRP